MNLTERDRTGVLPALAPIGGHDRGVSIPPRELSEWCALYLGAPAERVIFSTQQISSVTGLRLLDGRRVVVKVRPTAERIRTCTAVQKLLWERGFACPQALAGPSPYGDAVATAEALVDGGAALPRTCAAPLFGRTLAQIVGLVTEAEAPGTLEPAPYWMNWDHDLAGTWPPDPSIDMNARPGPDWLERAGAASRARLCAGPELPNGIGHADWESQNLRWRGTELHVAHDWDSLVRRPEAIIAGMASLMFPSTGTANEAATIEESETFLDAYQAERRRVFARDELELAWAAGLWIGAWKAKKALVHDDPAVAADLADHAQERLRRAGVQT